MVMAEIGGPLAHHIPLNNHRGALVQPSLVMNHHLDLECHGTDINPKKQHLSLCVGCGSQIHDQYILRVAPDLEWHAACLKCQECRQFLDENCTCFVREGKTYCKRDYSRLFGTKCDKCGCSFRKGDFVMRARTKIFHVDCFTCSVCTRHLIPGDEFALRDGVSLYCKEDHDAFEKSSQNSLTSLENNNNSNNINNNNNNNNNPSLSNNNHSSELGSMSDSGSESGSHKSIRDKRPSGPSADGKPTRVRTVLNEKQLHTLRNFYNANPRPDALMKDQIVDMSGLSPRVIRVWFQNKRCKDKKNQIKREMQEKNTTYDVMQGIPMVAQSPVRQSSPCQELNVFSYQPPWTALSEYGMQIDLRNDEINLDNKPTFQRLINQMHGYDDINMVNLSTYAHNQIHISSVPNDKYQYNNLQYLNNSDSSATLPDSDNSNETS